MKSLRSRKVGESANLQQWEALTADRRWHFEQGNRLPDIAKIRIAFDSTDAGLALCNLSGQVVTFNDSFQQLLQLGQRESLYDKNIVEICKPMIDIAFVDESAADGISRCEVRVVANVDDVPYRVMVSAKRINGSEGVPRWLMITMMQLSEKSSRTMAVQQLQMDFSAAEKLSGIAHWYATIEPGISVRDFPLVWSLGATHMFGVEHNQLPLSIGDWCASIPIVDRGNMLQRLQSLTERGIHETVDYRMNVGGIEKIFSSRCFRIKDPFDSNRYLLLGTERDITAEYSLEHEMQLAVSTFKMLFDASEWLTCIVDQRLNLVYMNDSLSSALREIGVPKRNEKLALLNLFDSVQKRRAVLRNYRRAIAGSRLAQEITIVDGRGILRRYDFNFTPLTSRSGAVIAVSIHGLCVGTANQVGFEIR